MTATTSNLDTRSELSTRLRHRRRALSAGSLLAGIGSRLHAFVEAGQLGPDAERAIARHTGART